MRDPDTVAGVVNVLRQVHGDDIARVRVNDGLSLAVLIESLLRSQLSNQQMVKLVMRALRSGDFHCHAGLRFSLTSQVSLRCSQLIARLRHGHRHASRHHCHHGHSLAADVGRELIGANDRTEYLAAMQFVPTRVNYRATSYVTRTATLMECPRVSISIQALYQSGASFHDRALQLYKS